MGKHCGIHIAVAFILSQFLTRSQAIGARPSSSSSEKFEPYSNETRAGASTSKLDRIFTPKIYPDGPLKRSGIGIEKGPPDLQFGLAFTVPFVSLSTQRLLNQVTTQRGYDSLWDLANVLKLNVGGLVVAAVVGMAALIFLPTLLPRFGGLNNGYGGYGGGGGGGWAGNGFGGFFPGFLDQLIPGFGLNKPLGYGQTDAYPYKDSYYGSYSERKENQGKSRALNDEPKQNQTGNFWSNVFREVRNTAKEFETCALYAICERGKNESTSNTSKDSKPITRGGRKEGSEDESIHMSSIEHILEAVRGIGGNDLPGLAQFKKAFENGKSGQQCSKYYKQCPLANLQIGKMVQSVGDYVFN